MRKNTYSCNRNVDTMLIRCDTNVARTSHRMYVPICTYIQATDEMKRASSCQKNNGYFIFLAFLPFPLYHSKMHTVAAYCFSPLQEATEVNNRRQQRVILRTTGQRRQQEVFEWMHIQLQDCAQSGDLWRRTSEPIDPPNSARALMSWFRPFRAMKRSVYSISQFLVLTGMLVLRERWQVTECLTQAERNRIRKCGERFAAWHARKLRLNASRYARRRTAINIGMNRSSALA